MSHVESDHPSHHTWGQREEEEVQGSALMNEIGDKGASATSKITQEGKKGHRASGRTRRTGKGRNFWHASVL